MLDSKVAAAAEGDAVPPAVVGGWTVRLLADGGHLKDGLQRAWGFEDAVLVGGEVRVFILDL